MRYSKKTISLLASLFLFTAQMSFAQTIITIDHADNTATIKEKGKTKAKTIDGKEIFVRPADIKVKVINTNTAFWNYQITKEDIEAKDLKELKSFLSAVGPYLTDFSTVTFSILDIESFTDDQKGKEAQRGLEKVLRDIENELKALTNDVIVNLNKINNSLFGSNGIHYTYSETINSLPLIAASPADESKKLKDKLGDIFTPTPKNQLKEIQNLKQSYLDLTIALAEYSEKISERRNRYLSDSTIRPYVPEMFKQFDDLKTTAQKAINESQQVLASAYEVEKLVQRCINVSVSKDLSSFPLKYDKGKKITISISAPSDPHISRLAKEAPYSLTLELQPRRLIKPAVGISFIYSKESVFSTFGTKDNGSGQFEIVEPSKQDSRFLMGLTLGAYYEAGDKLDIGIEGLLNPNDSGKAFGLGGTVVIADFIKLSGGWLWTKHTVLRDGQKLGTVLDVAGDLKTKESYKSPEFYLGFSIVGWPPFTND